MSDAIAVIKEASVLGPVTALEATIATNTPGYQGGLRGVYTYDATTANASATLPTKTIADGRTVIRPLQGKFIRVFNRSADSALDFAFGVGAAPTLVHGQLAAFGTGSAAAGCPVPPGGYVDWIVPNDATHMSWILQTGAAASKVTFYCSEGPVNT